MTPETCIKLLDWRYATKEFDSSKKISLDVWDALRKTLVAAPSSFGMQLWQYIDVQNPEIREKLKAASWNQDQIVDADHIVVFCVRREVVEADCDRHIGRMCEIRDMTPDMLVPYKQKFTQFYQAKSATEAVSWVDRQVYIALGFAMFAAAALGVDTCAIEGMSTDQYNDILELEGTPYRAICALAFGYRNPSDKYASIPKVRFREEDVIRVI